MLMNKPLEGIGHIMYDLDGTLLRDVDPRGASQVFIECITEGLSSQGRNYNPVFIEAMMEPEWGRLDTKIFADLIHDDPVAAEEGRKVYLECMLDKYPPRMRVIQGVLEMLAARKAGGYVQSLATGIRRKLLDRVLLVAELDPDLFDSVKTVDDLPNPDNKGKPNPALARTILTELDIKAEQTVGIGDSKNDIGMYRKAGILPVGVLSGNLKNYQQARKAGAAFVIDNVTQLVRLLPAQVGARI